MLHYKVGPTAPHLLLPHFKHLPTATPSARPCPSRRSYIFNQIKKVMDTSFGEEESVYNRRIRDQPHLYGRVQQRMAEFAEELQLGPGEGGEEAKATPRRKGKPSFP